jgi:nitrate/nitrite transporter NarK
MVDMRMFLHRPVLFSNLAGLFVGFGMFAQFLGVSYLAQVPRDIAGYGFGASVLRASVEYLLPSTIASLVVSQSGGVLIRRIGPRLTLALSAVIGIIGFTWLAAAHSSTPSVIGAGMAVGTAISLGYAAMPALIVAGVPPHQTGIANGINSISRSVGSAIGSALITSLLASRTIENLPSGAPPLPAESQFTLSFTLAGLAFAFVLALSLVGLKRGQQAPRTEPLPATEPAAATTAA